MRALQVQALCSLALLLLVASTCEASTLEDTCKSFAAIHADVGYDYCMKTFQADKASAVADARDLAAIAAKIARATAKATGARIDALMRTSEGNAARRQRLGVCAEVYSAAVDQLGEAAKDIVQGKAEETQDALTQLSAALDAPSTCEDAFSEADDASPLAAEDADFEKQAAIALAVAASLS